MNSPSACGHRGNKASLPSKPCERCGLPMTWRKRWAKNWAEVKYCSDACRRNKAGRAPVVQPAAGGDARAAARRGRS